MDRHVVAERLLLAARVRSEEIGFEDLGAWVEDLRKALDEPMDGIGILHVRSW